MIKKIVSGGQTGVDQAAIDAAIAKLLPYGGWCPKGRIAENGLIPAHYVLKETKTNDYRERTRLNVIDSDATLIIVPDDSFTISEGTRLTMDKAEELKKPLFVVSLSELPTFDTITAWLQQHDITVLNIAGPRESNTPGIYLTAFDFLKKLYADWQ